MSTNKPNTDTEGDVATLTRQKTARPPLYKVILLNDDYTPMEFVIEVLRIVFGIDESQAYVIMMTVHTKGAAVVGVFTFEIAETKVVEVMTMARQQDHPLQCVLEKED